MSVYVGRHAAQAVVDGQWHASPAKYKTCPIAKGLACSRPWQVTDREGSETDARRGLELVAEFFAVGCAPFTKRRGQLF